MEFVCQRQIFYLFFLYVLLCENGHFRFIQNTKEKLNFVSIDSHFRKMTNGKLVEISEIHINMFFASAAQTPNIS